MEESNPYMYFQQVLQVQYQLALELLLSRERNSYRPGELPSLSLQQFIW
jgi:hypothetical protein